MTENGKKAGKATLTHALTAALAGAGAWLAAHATTPAQAMPQTSELSALRTTSELTALRTVMEARFDQLAQRSETRWDQLNQRLSHLEGVWDARRAMPAKATGQ